MCFCAVTGAMNIVVPGPHRRDQRRRGGAGRGGVRRAAGRAGHRTVRLPAVERLDLCGRPAAGYAGVCGFAA